MDSLNTASIFTQGGLLPPAEGLSHTQVLRTPPDIINSAAQPSARNSEQQIRSVVPRWRLRSRRIGDNPAHRVSAGPITHIIIICLSYYGMSWDNGQSMTLKGPKNDFSLLLDHFKYGEPDTSIQFTLLHDFDLIGQGPDGQPRHIYKTDTSKEAIMKAIENTMQSVPQGGKVVFYFSGHAIEGQGQAIAAGDGALLSGSEIKTCLENILHDSVSVAAVFDTSHCGRSMGLPYDYKAKGGVIRVKRVTRKKQKIPMIQISAALRGQLAYSIGSEDCCVGQLTQCLTQYLKTTTDFTIEDLASYLYRNCDPTGAQLAQVSASHSFHGPTSFF